MRSGGSRHIKWKDRGQPSQQRKRPIPRQTEQKSWLTKSASALPLPLTFRVAPLLAPVALTRADPPTRRPLPLAETPARTWVSPPRVGRAIRLASSRSSRSRALRPRVDPMIVCTSALTSFVVGAEKMLSACAPAGTLSPAGVLRELGALEPSREVVARAGVPRGVLAPVPFCAGVDARPDRRGRVAMAEGGAGL